jgi:adenylate cyclase
LLQGKHGEAVAEARISIELAPSSADISSIAAFVFCCSDLAEEAIVETEKTLQLHPNHPAYYLGNLGTAYRLAGRFDEAIAAFKAFDERNAGFGLIDLVILYQQLARSKEAESAAAQLLTLRPQFSVRAWADTQFLADVARLESEIEALVNSGLPYDS